MLILALYKNIRIASDLHRLSFFSNARCLVEFGLKDEGPSDSENLEYSMWEIFMFGFNHIYLFFLYFVRPSKSVVYGRPEIK